MTTNVDQVRGWLKAAIDGEIPADDIDQVLDNMIANGLIAPELPAASFSSEDGASWEIGDVTIHNWGHDGSNICIHVGTLRGWMFDLETGREIAKALMAAVATAKRNRERGYR